MGLMVIDSGFWTTVQDAGRVGYREWGVPAGGAFDHSAADLANALVGNGAECAVLELTLRGGIFESLASVAIALAGAPMEASVVSPDGNPRRVRTLSSCSLHAGDRLVLGRTLEGARTYLAVQGGFQTPLRLGSRSTEQPLRRGDFLRATATSLPTRHLGEPTWNKPAARPFRIMAGPEGKALIASEFWKQGRFRVGSRSNRMGLRLEGPVLEMKSQPDRLSAPVAPARSRSPGDSSSSWAWPAGPWEVTLTSRT